MAPASIIIMIGQKLLVSYEPRLSRHCTHYCDLIIYNLKKLLLFSSDACQKEVGGLALLSLREAAKPTMLNSIQFKSAGIFRRAAVSLPFYGSGDGTTVSDHVGYLSILHLLTRGQSTRVERNVLYESHCTS